MTLLSKRKHTDKFKRLTAITAVLMIIISLCDIIYPINKADAASYSVSISLSQNEIKTGSSVTLKAATGGSSGSFEYDFLYSIDNKTYYYIQTWTTNSSVNFKPNNFGHLKDYTGTVYVLAHARLNGTDVKTSTSKILNIIPKDDESLRVTGDVKSAGTYIVGEPLIVTLTASGGKAPYQYKYEYCKSGSSYSTLQDWSETSSKTVKTDSWAANTDYSIKVTVKDDNGNTFSYVSMVSLKVKPVPTPVISSFSVPSVVKIGEKAKLNCDVTSGTSPYKYKFIYIDNTNNSEKTIANYSTNDNVNWDTSSLSEGNYTVKVYIKDKNGKTASQKATVKLSKTPTLAPTISTDPTSADVVKGKDITFIVDDHASDTEDYPPHPYKFKFEYKKDGGSYQTLRDYTDSDSSNEKYKFSTKDLSAGKYILRATIKDKNGKEYSKTCNFTVTVPKITFSIDAGSKEFFTGGGNEKAVIAINNIKGGTSDSYEYKFEYVKYGELNSASLTPPDDSSDWQSIKNFSSENTTDFTVDSADDAGIYAIRVSVQNTGNSDSSLIYRQIIKGYTVKVKVEHTLADLNALIDKVDTWCSGSIQSLDMVKKISEWKAEGNDHYDEYPFVFSDYEAAYNAAKSANTDGNKDYDTLYANLETQFDALKRLVGSGYVSADLETGDTPLGIANTIFALYKSLLSTLTNTFKSLSDSSVTSAAMYGFDYNAVADKIFPLFKTFAYAIIIILAGINAIESALQYEMFTMRGGVKLLGRLVFAKVWVDISLVVCRGIVAIAIEWLGKITSLTTDILNNINVGATLKSSDAWIIGWLIDFFNGLLLALGMLLLIIPLIIFVIILYAKLFVRSFELAILQCVSPVFFACLTGETTKQYFRKFILTYISVVFEVVFMAIVWYIYIEYLNEAFSISATTTSITEMYSLENGILNFFMVSVGAFILMIKPPRILKNLITA
ncbi:MAG: type IV secretion system protein [Clostridia bacterium]|nr:type IV secretion system protein [Clostridia bacterium]